MRPRPDAGVIATAPDFQIMAALMAGPRVVGNFVSLKAGVIENCLRDFLKRRPGVLVGSRNMIAEKRRSRLDGQLIDG